MLEVKNISFAYEKKQILQNLSFSLQKGEILAVMGPSGCGKTTLLSLIAGLKKPSEGEIVTSQARIAYVFQEPRLFPWLTARENLEAVIKKPREKQAQIQSLLEAVGLAPCADLYPHELSGGMKMRLSLARALLFDADLYLFDEPFSAIDDELKESISLWLKDFLKQKGAVAILVTHQREDAERLCDRTIVLQPLQAISDLPKDH